MMCVSPFDVEMGGKRAPACKHAWRGAAVSAHVVPRHTGIIGSGPAKSPSLGPRPRRCFKRPLRLQAALASHTVCAGVKADWTPARRPLGSAQPDTGQSAALCPGTTFGDTHARPMIAY